MCEQCVLATEWHYPHLSEEERGDILMSATCFPFGSPELVDAQLEELVEKTDGTVFGAVAFAKAELDRQFKEFKQTQEENEESVLC